MQTLEDTINNTPAWNTTQHLTNLKTLKTQHVANGGHAKVFQNAATDLYASRRQEALEDGRETDAAHYGEILLGLHDGLAIDYARRFSATPGTTNRHTDRTPDYLAAARLGLWAAITTYQPGSGTFSPWAYRRIRSEVIKALQQEAHQTLSRGDVEYRQHVLHAVKELTGPDGQEPSDAQVLAHIKAGSTAKHAKFRESTVARIRTQPKHYSYSAIVSDEAGSDPLTMQLRDTVDLEEQYLEAEDADRVRSTVADLLGRLPERDRLLVTYTYGLDGQDPRSLTEIAQVLGLSREGVRQVQMRLLDLFRDALGPVEAQGQ